MQIIGSATSSNRPPDEGYCRGRRDDGQPTKRVDCPRCLIKDRAIAEALDCIEKHDEKGAMDTLLKAKKIAGM